MKAIVTSQINVTSLLQVLVWLLFFSNTAIGQTDVLSCPEGTIVSNQMTFSTEHFSIVHARGSSSNFAKYSPWRVYQDNTVTITGSVDVQRIRSIVINAESTSYATVVANANVSVQSGAGTVVPSSSGNVATLTVTGTNVKSIRLIPNAQTRWSSITINYDLAVSCAVPANPNGEITPSENPSCEAVTLTYEHGTAQPQSGVSYFWQTSATGTSTANPVANTYSATTGGNYFVRAFNGTCWSSDSYQIESPLVINSAVEISSDPQNQAAFTGGNAMFSVSANGSGTLYYQWQERPANGGTWTNIGTNSPNLNLNNLQLAQNNFRYRVLVANSCGTINSSVAMLSVSEGPCVNENFQGASEPEGWEFDGTTWGGQSCSGNDGVVFDNNGDFAVTPIINNPQTLTFNRKRSGNSASWAMDVQISTNATYTTWVTVETISSISTSCVSQTIDLTAYPGARKIKFLDNRGSGSHQRTIDDVVIICAPSCVPEAISVWPTSGPEHTQVTILGNNFAPNATVKFGTVLAFAEVISATEIRATVPAGANGPISVDTTLDCDSEVAFSVITAEDANCEGQSQIFSDLIISEITDHGSGAHSYIELFNGTGSTVNLSQYSVRIHNNGASHATGTIALSGSLAPNSVYIVAIGGGDMNNNYGGHVPNITNGVGGINNNDHVRLYRNSTWIDLWGDTSENAFTVASKDYFYRRKNTGIVAPSTTWNASDWEFDSPVDYSDIGQFEFSPGLPPHILSQPTLEATCGRATLTIVAEESYVGGLPIAYQWFIHVPGTTNWTPIADSSNFNGTQSPVLTIANISGLEQHQFYCQVRENSALCFRATNAIKIGGENQVVIWNGSSWLPNPPDINSNAIINGNYSTANGSFEAKRLINNGSIIIIENSYIKLAESLVNNASFVIENNGSLVQVCDEAENSGNIIVHRTTSPMYRYDFTYWSSPVISNSNFTLHDLSPQTLFDKYFKWNAVGQNWETILHGSEVMREGFGYIVRAPQTFSVNTAETENFHGSFVGVPTNGIVEVPVVGSVDSWNLLGNPYPSAIHADDFLSDISNSSTIDGTIYLWAHNSAPSDEIEGDEVYNYNPADYAAYNFTGGVSTSSNAETDVTVKTPTGFVASGQAFFVKGTVNGTALFNNSMRVSGFNNQFFRSANPNQGKNRIWLNLTNETNGFNQALVGYLEGATNGLDRGFDGELLGGNSVSFYSVLEDKRLTIQGKSLPFDADDTVALGYSSTTSGTLTIAIDHFEGIFSDESVYLEDKLLAVVHDLKQNPYSFQSTSGTFNSRFVLRYKRETLSHDSHGANNSQVVAYRDKSGYVISSKNNLIESVQVYDLTGKILIDAQSIQQNSVPVYLEGMSDQVLLAKVTLETGTVTTIKLLKL